MKVNVESKQGVARVFALAGIISFDAVNYHYTLDESGELEISDGSQIMLFDDTEELIKIIIDANETQSLDLNRFSL